MNRIITMLQAIILASIFIFAAISEAQNMDKNQTLNTKQQSIISIAAFTAKGNMGKLKAALNKDLDAGLTVNEIKEILVQMYAYCGFPRSLNGIGAFWALWKSGRRRASRTKLVRKQAPCLPTKAASNSEQKFRHAWQEGRSPGQSLLSLPP